MNEVIWYSITVVAYTKPCLFIYFYSLLLSAAGAEHKASVLHVPLAHPTPLPGVSPPRCHPDLGLAVLRSGSFPLSDTRLLRHAQVSLSAFHFCRLQM